MDIEVHGLTPQQLEEILDGLGGRLEMGASGGHRDFGVTVDPFLGTEQAARRRDFTINALMEDVLTGRVLDHFRGLRDLRRGVLRHVDDRTFPEDPLRVLRGPSLPPGSGSPRPRRPSPCAGASTCLPCRRSGWRGAAQGPASGGAPLTVFSRLCGTWASCPTGFRRWRP